MKLPRPRYKNVIVMDPAHFNWLPVPDAPGVERKYFGSFSERAFWIELKLRPLTVTVLDPGGHPIVVKREDSSGILRPQIVLAKAWACLGTGHGGAACT